MGCPRRNEWGNNDSRLEKVGRYWMSCYFRINTGGQRRWWWRRCDREGRKKERKEGRSSPGVFVADDGNLVFGSAAVRSVWSQQKTPSSLRSNAISLPSKTIFANGLNPLVSSDRPSRWADFLVWCKPAGNRNLLNQKGNISIMQTVSQVSWYYHTILTIYPNLDVGSEAFHRLP